MKTLCSNSKHAYRFPSIMHPETSSRSKLDKTRPNVHEKLPLISSSMPLRAKSEELLNIFWWAEAAAEAEGVRTFGVKSTSGGVPEMMLHSLR